MKTQEDVKAWLCDFGHEDTIVFEDPDYAAAFIGVADSGQAVYDYDLMVQSLIDQDGMTYEDAAEFIDYNTLRAIPYIGDMAPIVMYRAE